MQDSKPCWFKILGNSRILHQPGDFVMKVKQINNLSDLI